MDEQSTPANTMRERTGMSRVAYWILVGAHRREIAGLLVATTFLALVGVGALVPDVTARLDSGDPVETTFQAFIGATVTGVTLVLTINQLVLSQELGAVADQRERMDGAMEFREDVEETLGITVSPPEPSTFFRVMVEYIRDTSATLAESVESDGDLAATVRTLHGDIEQNADAVLSKLDDAEFGTFDVVSAALDFNYSWKLYAARSIRNEYADSLADEQADALDDLVDALGLFGPTREHFKTLYIQWELVNLSRSILLTAVPAILVAVSVLLFLDVTVVGWDVVGVPGIVVVLSAAVSASLVPFLVLLAYVLRIATVTKRTLAIGPFVLRKESENVDWNPDDD
jgi:hypothetical protein